MSTLTEDHVREALKQVIDPELFVNIVDLGLIYDIEIVSGEKPEDSAAKVDSAETESTASEAVADAAEPLDPTGQPAVESYRVKIEMTMTSPMCPAGPQLVGQSKEFVSKLDGVTKVDVKVVMDPPWTPEKMTEEARDQLGIF